MKPLSEWTEEELWGPVLDAGHDGRDGAKAAEREAAVSELLRREREAMRERCQRVIQSHIEAVYYMDSVSREFLESLVVIMGAVKCP